MVIKSHLGSEHLLKLRAMVSPFCPCILENVHSLPLCRTAVLYCTHIFPSLMSEEATEYGGFSFGFLWVYLFTRHNQSAFRYCSDGSRIRVFVEQALMSEQAQTVSNEIQNTYQCLKLTLEQREVF